MSAILGALSRIGAQIIKSPWVEKIGKELISSASAALATKIFGSSDSDSDRPKLTRSTDDLGEGALKDRARMRRENEFVDTDVTYKRLRR